MHYYRKTLEERMHLIYICPQELVAPYNNTAMLDATYGNFRTNRNNSLIKELNISTFCIFEKVAKDNFDETQTLFINLPYLQNYMSYSFHISACDKAGSNYPVY